MTFPRPLTTLITPFVSVAHASLPLLITRRFTLYPTPFASVLLCYGQCILCRGVWGLLSRRISHPTLFGKVIPHRAVYYQMHMHQDELGFDYMYMDIIFPEEHIGTGIRIGIIYFLCCFLFCFVLCFFWGGEGGPCAFYARTL
ncbi:hypothetical protein BDU57DRAFT_373210 [Ampelomyces quisqualis]|uniref:Uncharacterized protein n=1 Tax=Ampelomyces quisqualis TaxID=50730 RepID=A0A6A5QCX2_AMPQU|nr:hypothetical protein BDU57DRAFT_373210 [Ampelomyces quisqualis]